VSAGRGGPARRGRAARRLAAWARASAIVLALLTEPAAAAEGPSVALQLTRLDASSPPALFSVPTPAGGTLNLSDFKGQVVLLNFWATWCEPCLEEMPALGRLAHAFRGRGLAIVALSVDREGAAVVRPFLKRRSLTFAVGLDRDQSVARSHRVWALPSTFVLDRTLARRYLAQGARDWASPSAFAFFDAMLKLVH
jgi:peroxiredoxin